MMLNEMAIFTWDNLQ